MHATTLGVFIGLLLTLKGFYLLFKAHPRQGEIFCHLLRDRLFTLATFGGASAWFLYLVSQLGEADFGNYRTPLFVLFFVVILGSFFKVRELLSVRGLAILTLLVAREILYVDYMEPAPVRPFISVLVYVAIVAALYFGAVPFRLRDFIQWVFKTTLRSRVFGSGLLLYGVCLIVLSFI